MATFKTVNVTTQPAGIGYQQAATDPVHPVRKQEFDAAMASLAGQLTASRVTVSNSNSLSLALVSGTQQLSGAVIRKTAALAAGEGAIIETVAGLVFAIDSGLVGNANAAASGAQLVATNTAVAGKAALAHTHAEADVMGLVADLAARSLVGHVHVIGDVTGLPAALAGLLPLSGTIAESQVSGLVADLGNRSPVGHTHVEGDVAGLTADLAARSLVGHTHPDATYTVDGFMAAADKMKLDNLAAQTVWLPSVATVADLPLNTDPIGACRLVRTINSIFQCISNVGFTVNQWVKISGVGKTAGAVGDGVSTVVNFLHNLGTIDVVAQIRHASGTLAYVDCDVAALDENTVRFSFAVAPGSGTLWAIVTG